MKINYVKFISNFNQEFSRFPSDMSMDLQPIDFQTAWQIYQEHRPNALERILPTDILSKVLAAVDKFGKYGATTSDILDMIPDSQEKIQAKRIIPKLTLYLDSLTNFQPRFALSTTYLTNKLFSTALFITPLSIKDKFKINEHGKHILEISARNLRYSRFLALVIAGIFLDQNGLEHWAIQRAIKTGQYVDIDKIKNELNYLASDPACKPFKKELRQWQKNMKDKYTNG